MAAREVDETTLPGTGRFVQCRKAPQHLERGSAQDSVPRSCCSEAVAAGPAVAAWVVRETECSTEGPTAPVAGPCTERSERRRSAACTCRTDRWRLVAERYLAVVLGYQAVPASCTALRTAGTLFDWAGKAGTAGCLGTRPGKGGGSPGSGGSCPDSQVCT